MRPLTFFFAVWLLAPDVWAQAPSCAEVETTLGALPISPDAWVVGLQTGESRAATCEIGPQLRCDDIVATPWSARRATWSGTTAEFEALDFSDLRVERASFDGAKWTLKNPSTTAWSADELVIEHSPRSCRWGALRVDGIWVDAATDTQLEGVSVHGLPTFVNAWDKPAPGFLPPTLRYAQAFETSLNAFVLGWLGLGVDGSSEWLGGHALLASDDARVLEVGVVVPDEDDSTAHIVGSVKVSDRVSGMLERSDPSLLDGRGLETGAFSRVEHRSRVGLSLRGTRHALTVFGNEARRVPATGTESLTQAGLKFAAQETLGMVQLDADVDHVSRSIVAPGVDDSVHGSQVALRIALPFGRPSLGVTPGLDAGMTFGIIPSEDGFEASTTASLVPNLEAHLGLLGKFENFDHLLSLRGRLGAEVYGFTQREPLPPRLPAYVFGREADQIFAQVELENGIETRRVRASLPVGLRYSTAEDVSGWMGAAVQSEAVQGRVTLLCEQACEDVHGDVSGRLTVGRVTLAAGASKGQPATGFLAGMGVTSGPGTDALLATKEGGDGWTGLGRVNFRLARFESDLRVFSAEKTQGTDLNLHFNTGLGWRLSLAGGLDVKTKTHVVMGGVTFRP